MVLVRTLPVPVALVALVMVVMVSACGCHGSPPAAEAGGERGEGPSAGAEDGLDEPQDDAQGDDRDAVMDPSDPSLEIDPQLCQVDSDCMVGTPRDCCTGFCPEHAVAWSHVAWAAYQEVCAIVECSRSESLACLPESELGPPPSARCVRERCVLR